MVAQTTNIGLPKFQLGRVEAFIRDLNTDRIKRYLKYWDGIRPTTHEEYYDRWVFAFASIHTTWQKNVECFKEVKALSDDFKWPQLYGAVKRSKAGLTKMRTTAIWDFHKRFWSNPEYWYPQKGESLPDCRTRLAKATFGIGLTKTSFVLEMAFPKECDVVCLDTHILQLYDYYRKDTPNPSVYRAMEQHWIEQCDKRGISSPMVRHLYWDKVQKQPDTRYWSYVLEKKAA